MKINSLQTSKEKFNYLTIFFVNQCSLLTNKSVFPADLPELKNKYHYPIIFLSSDIAKTISYLDPDKAHSHDKLCIQIINLCGNSICKPFKNNFQ